MVLELVFLSPLVDHLTGFGQVSILTILQHISLSYVTIDEIGPEENAIKIMGTYNPKKPISWLIKQLGKGVEFARAGVRQFLTPWWFQKGSHFWHIRQCSMRTSESGDIKPSTRIHGHTSRFPFADSVTCRVKRCQPQEKGDTLQR